MKVLVVCQRYWPEQFQITPICEELAARGHEVTVLCGLPNVGVPDGEPGIVPEEYRHGRNREQEHNGVRIVRSFEVGRRSDLLHRVANYYSFWKSENRKARTLEGDFDVVLAYQLSPAMMAVTAVTYGRSTGTPVYLYCCDLWPESLKAGLGQKAQPIVAHYGRICRRMYQGANCIGMQSPTFRGYFEGYHGIAPEKLVYHPQFSTDEAGGAVALSPHEGVNLLFMGNMGAVQGIPWMIEAMARLSHVEGLTLHFVGDGSELLTAQELVGKLGLEGRVVFRGRHPVEEMPRFYAMADICVLGLDDSSLIGTTIPSKLQGYMAAGRAVVGAVSGGARVVIEESGCGVVVGPGDVDGMARAIAELARDAAKRVEYARNARAYFERNFTKEAYLDVLEGELRRLAGEESVAAADLDPTGVRRVVEGPVPGKTEVEGAVA